MSAIAIRSEEHTSELQSQSNLVCRLLLEKKNVPHDEGIRGKLVHVVGGVRGPQNVRIVAVDELLLHTERRAGFPKLRNHRLEELPDPAGSSRSEEHTSELQSQSNLVCRLLLEKKKKNSHI